MKPSTTERKARIKADMAAAREKTIWLLSCVPDDFLKKRLHFFYSPIGWHFGHIARTEEYWILCKALGRECLDEQNSFLFADLPENPKENRINLPSRAEIVEFLATVRRSVERALDETDIDSDDPLLADGYAWEFALQHECQHQETICEMLQLIQLSASGESSGWAQGIKALVLDDAQVAKSEMVLIRSGSLCMGSDDPQGYDNEKQSHIVQVDSFELARTQVTAGQWLAFIADRGYRRKELWSEEGWAWRAEEGAEKPEYWVDVDRGYAYAGPHGIRAIDRQEAVSCISWFEAEAFARWAGMRLPTEQEWEYAARGSESRIWPWGNEPGSDRSAAFGMSTWGPQPIGSCPNGASPFGVLDMAGNVWEWTSTPFLPYPGFEAFPYDGYSKDHMKGFHKVCRGGSWATSMRILRSSFRNWYVPTYRQGLLGLRLAR